MPRALWKDAVIAESDETIVVEGNHCFPREAVRGEHLRPSETTSHCPWKGDASYYHVAVDVNEDAAWTYPTPKPEAEAVRDRIAFWRGVEIEA